MQSESVTAPNNGAKFTISPNDDVDASSCASHRNIQPGFSPIAGQTRGLSRFKGTLIYLISLLDWTYKNTSHFASAERLDDICDRDGQLGA
jgi:hypothetical protein